MSNKSSIATPRRERVRLRREIRTHARADRKQSLLEAAVACIRREGPGASMDQIAAEAGVTKPILYRHFRHKADLYEAIAAHFTTVVASNLRRARKKNAHPRVVLRAAIDSYIRLVEREREIYRFLMQRARLSRLSEGGPVENFMRQLGDEIGLVLGERMHDAGLDSGPAEVWGHAIVGMVSAAVDWWVDRPVLPRRRLVEYLTDLLWHGFRGTARAEVAEPVKAERPSRGVVVPMKGRT
jgi:AcrR family transcriptional regulator